jgi:hypothetical protein
VAVKDEPPGVVEAETQRVTCSGYGITVPSAGVPWFGIARRPHDAHAAAAGRTGIAWFSAMHVIGCQFTTSTTAARTAIRTPAAEDLSASIPQVSCELERGIEPLTPSLPWRCSAV